MPAELAALLQTPPLANAWFSEVSYVAGIYALGDLQDFDDEGMMAFEYSIMASLAESKLYRFMFRMMDSRMILRTAAAAWSRFHRGGTTLASDNSADGLRLTLRFPEALFDPLFLRGFSHVWRAIIDRSRTPAFRVDVEELVPGVATYLLVPSEPGV